MLYFAAAFGDREAPRYWRSIANEVSIDGLWIEMGVCSGYTAKQIIKNIPENKKLYGFDWFQGLPEDWVLGGKMGVVPKGETFGFLPNVIPEVDGLIVVDGLFEDTLPSFVKNHEGNIAFLHIDCDLYSSTKTTFKHFKNKIVSGTIIAFDEIGGYPNYMEGEYKAFMEFIEETGLKHEMVAFVYKSTVRASQITFKIL